MRYGTHVHGRPGRNDLILFVAAALQKTEPKMISEDFTFTQKRPFCFVVAIFLCEPICHVNGLRP